MFSENHCERQTKNDPLSDFINVMADLIDEVIALEGSPAVGDRCDCFNGERTTRCVECPINELKCDSCFLAKHDDMPFHHAEKWNGSFFAKGSQCQLGRVIYVGHGSKPCPLTSPPQMLTVVDVTGIHTCRIMYCSCGKASDGEGSNVVEKWRQLVRVGLIPASIRSPATACTIPMLKQHHLLNTVGKLSTMDYATTLRRLTNGSSPLSVPVRM